MTRRVVIGLLGAKGSGRGAVAGLLVARHGFRAVACGDALKRLCRDLFDLDEETLWGPSPLRDAPDSRGASARYWTGVWERAADRIVGWRAELFDAMPGGAPDLDDLDAALGRELVHLERLRAAFTPRDALRRVGTEWARATWPGVWIHRVAAAVVASAAARVVVPDLRTPEEAAYPPRAGGATLWVDGGDDGPADHATEPRRATHRALAGGEIAGTSDPAVLESEVDRWVATLTGTMGDNGDGRES